MAVVSQRRDAAQFDGEGRRACRLLFQLSQPPQGLFSRFRRKGTIKRQELTAENGDVLALPSASLIVGPRVFRTERRGESDDRKGQNHAYDDLGGAVRWRRDG